MHRKLLILTALSLALLAPGPVHALTLHYEELGSDPGGSWTFAWGAAGGEYDEVQFWYRGDLDLGGGKFESPWLDNFRMRPQTGTIQSDPTWSVYSASSTRMVATGDATSLNPLDPRYYEFYTMHFDGTFGLQTGWDVVYYHDHEWAWAWTMERKSGTGGYWRVNNSSFDPGSVPEPGTVSLLGIAFSGMALAAWRRRRRNGARVERESI